MASCEFCSSSDWRQCVFCTDHPACECKARGHRTEPTIEPTACAFCGEGECFKCRPDLNPCACHRDGHPNRDVPTPAAPASSPSDDPSGPPGGAGTGAVEAVYPPMVVPPAPPSARAPDQRVDESEGSVRTTSARAPSQPQAGPRVDRPAGGRTRLPRPGSRPPAVELQPIKLRLVGDESPAYLSVMRTLKRTVEQADAVLANPMLDRRDREAIARIREEALWKQAGHCRRCGVELSDPQSVMLGYGPECARAVVRDLPLNERPTYPPNYAALADL